VLDDQTPREVWIEYEALKSNLARLGSTPEAYERGVNMFAEALGIGVPPEELNAAQRAAQARAIQRHRGSQCEP
jgi:hypothetical protein